LDVGAGVEILHTRRNDVAHVKIDDPTRSNATTTVGIVSRLL
jgi:hypothetical protein